MVGDLRPLGSRSGGTLVSHRSFLCKNGCRTGWIAKPLPLPAHFKSFPPFQRGSGALIFKDSRPPFSWVLWDAPTTESMSIWKNMDPMSDVFPPHTPRAWPATSVGEGGTWKWPPGLYLKGRWLVPCVGGPLSLGPLHPDVACRVPRHTFLPRINHL